MIEIGKPEVVHNGNKARLQAEFNIDGKIDTVWFEVDLQYGKYLCHERSDAFLIAVLNYAMREKHDIVLKSPVSEYLYYNIETYLIPGLVEYNKIFYRPNITADVATEKLDNAGAVGTGVSLGVDSLHSIASQTNSKYKGHNITHLTFNNVGSHGEGLRAQNLYSDRVKMVKQFAEEYNFELILSNSNLMDVIKQNHFKTHTYSSVFAVYCLQKLFSIFYYASAGHKYHEFTLADANNGPSSYELLSLPVFSTPNLRIYSEGENMSRMDKIRKIVQYEPSYKYLNVCTDAAVNCNKCEKCTRTLLALDALNVLDKYNDVFDIEYYRKNRQKYLSKLVYYKTLKNKDYIETFHILKHEISLLSWFEGKSKVIITIIKMKFVKMISPRTKSYLKALLKKIECIVRKNC